MCWLSFFFFLPTAGNPAPSLSLYKQVKNTWSAVTDKRFVLNQSSVYITSAQLSDSGVYSLRANVSIISSYAEMVFSITVTGKLDKYNYILLSGLRDGLQRNWICMSLTFSTKVACRIVESISTNLISKIYKSTQCSINTLLCLEKLMLMLDQNMDSCGRIPCCQQDLHRACAIFSLHSR